MKPKWSKPYFGVFHAKNCPKSHQITMNAHGGDRYRVYLLHLQGDKPFTPVNETQGTLAECEKAAAKWLKLLT